MDIVGIDAVRYGADDLDAARRYFSQLGLTEVEHGATGARFVAMDQSVVEVRKTGDAAFAAPAVVSGPTLRELVFGVRTPDTLEAIGAELGKDREVTRDADGTLHSTDTTGYGIAFRVSRCRPVGPAAAPALNIPGHDERVDRPIDFKAPIKARHIGHAVFYVPDVKQASEFYIERLGFRESDRFIGTGSFMRAGGAREHHTLFMFAIPPHRGVHHVAFEVGDFHEVVMGGLAMQREGWKSDLGPGRHIIGSNYFWYFKNPCGGAIEYYADIDHMTDAWKCRDWEFKPEIAAGWMVDARGQKVEAF